MRERPQPSACMEAQAYEVRKTRSVLDLPTVTVLAAANSIVNFGKGQKARRKRQRMVKSIEHQL